MIHLRTARLAMLAGTVLITALVLAACGSSSNTSSGSASAGSSTRSAAGAPSSASRSKLVACLKSHGVTLPNRPAGARRPSNGSGESGGPPGGGRGFFFGGGGGRGGNGGAGGRFGNPKFRAAFQACGAGQFPRARFTPNKAAVTKFVACVNQHGYKLPAPNFSGKGPIFPAAIARNKKFQAASRACASDLRPQGAPGGSGGTGGNSGSSGSSGSSGGGSSSD